MNNLTFYAHTISILPKGGLCMADKNCNLGKDDRKGKPSASNDQLGENAGSGRIMKSADTGKKCK